RDIEGMFTIQKVHCKKLGLPWKEAKAQRTAQDAYERLFSYKWSPPGRGLWMMGTDFVYRHGGAALNNCGFVSTQHIDIDIAQPFCWLFEMSMLGVGVGFDTRGADKVTIKQAAKGDEIFVVDDSRQGWVEALRVLLKAYTGEG